MTFSPRTFPEVVMRSIVLPVLLVLSASAAHADDGATLARAIAERAGVQAFGVAEQVSFTWTHHPSGTARRFVWDRPANTVTVTIGEETTTVPAQGEIPEDVQRAHAAFVNDNYWAFFELHLAWDTGVTFEELGSQSVPGFAALGECPALAVRYGGEGGYTPGDHYVLYLGPDGLPVAWAFHRGGAIEPSLVTTRAGWQEFAGVKVPTRFEKDDGTLFISISDVQVR